MTAEMINYLVSILLSAPVYYFVVNSAQYSAMKVKIKKFEKTFDIDHVVLPKEFGPHLFPIPTKLSITDVNADVAYFVKVIKENIPESYLKNLYYRLEDLKVKKCRMLFKNSGVYDQLTNTISLGRNDAIYHELFHAISTTLDSKCCGFSTPVDGKIIGAGITEGYTEVLTYRYFGDKQKRMKSNNQSYEFEMDVCQQLEKIVGQNKMTELYLNANLHDLIAELKKYSSNDEIITFIRNVDLITECDALYVVSMFRNRKIQTVIKEIVSYLVKTHMRFLQRKLGNKEITEEECFIQHKEFVEFFYKKVSFFPRYEEFNYDDLFRVYGELDREQKRK